ncbi:MAG: hypothetical protein ACRENP_02295 [Longimicrobiales bacterium]
MPVYQPMVPNLIGYGYLWWIRSVGQHVMACALGLGGQFILVVPGLELVAAGTSALDARNPQRATIQRHLSAGGPHRSVPPLSPCRLGA